MPTMPPVLRCPATIRIMPRTGALPGRQALAYRASRIRISLNCVGGESADPTAEPWAKIKFNRQDLLTLG